MKRTVAIILTVAALMTAIGCASKRENENITFAATITDISDEGTTVQTSADVGFSTAIVHLAEGYHPDFTLKIGQTVQLTILPMMTKSIPPQVTAVSITLIAEPLDNGVASVTEGLDPMPMLTPGTEPVTDATEPDTLEAHMADMLPVLDAITRTMGVEGEQAFMPADPVFVWSVLAEVCGTWGYTVPETQDAGETVIVPESVLRAFALAAFNRTDALPPLPEKGSERVTYDQMKEAYVVTKSVANNASATGIDAVSDNGDGTYTVMLSLYNAAGERLGGVQFTLRDADAANGAYRYVVTGAKADKA